MIAPDAPSQVLELGRRARSQRSQEQGPNRSPYGSTTRRLTSREHAGRRVRSASSHRSRSSHSTGSISIVGVACSNSDRNGSIGGSLTLKNRKSFGYSRRTTESSPRANLSPQIELNVRRSTRSSSANSMWSPSTRTVSKKPVARSTRRDEMSWKRLPRLPLDRVDRPRFGVLSTVTLRRIALRRGRRGASQ